MVAAIVRDFGGFKVDTTDWPIILMEFPERRLSDKDLHDGLAYAEQLLRESQRLGLKSYQVVDLTFIREIAPASQRKYAAEWIKSTEALTRLASLGAACVTPSSILRGIVTAIMWIYRPPNPTEFFATRPQAYLHALVQLEGARVPLPQRLAELRARLAAQLAPDRRSTPRV